MTVFLSFFGGLQIGPVFDKKGPFWLILAGAILLPLAILLMGFCTSKTVALGLDAAVLTHIRILPVHAYDWRARWNGHLPNFHPIY
jgi:ABC-type uncharacterized transport system permease subunit